MLKILWVGYDLSGHLLPVIPLIKAFQEKGHQVDFYMEENWYDFQKHRQALESYGCNVITRKNKLVPDMIWVKILIR